MLGTWILWVSYWVPGETESCLRRGGGRRGGPPRDARASASERRITGGLWGIMRHGPTWSPKVCKTLAFLAIGIVVLGHDFTYFWGPGKEVFCVGVIMGLQGFRIRGPYRGTIGSTSDMKYVRFQCLKRPIDSGYITYIGVLGPLGYITSSSLLVHDSFMTLGSMYGVRRSLDLLGHF